MYSTAKCFLYRFSLIAGTSLLWSCEDREQFYAYFALKNQQMMAFVTLYYFLNIHFAGTVKSLACLPHLGPSQLLLLAVTALHLFHSLDCLYGISSEEQLLLNFCPPNYQLPNFINILSKSPKSQAPHHGSCSWNSPMSSERQEEGAKHTLTSPNLPPSLARFCCRDSRVQQTYTIMLHFHENHEKSCWQILPWNENTEENAPWEKLPGTDFDDIPLFSTVQRCSILFTEHALTDMATSKHFVTTLSPKSYTSFHLLQLHPLDPTHLIKVIRSVVVDVNAYEIWFFWWFDLMFFLYWILN